MTRLWHLLSKRVALFFVRPAANVTPSLSSSPVCRFLSMDISRKRLANAMVHLPPRTSKWQVKIQWKGDASIPSSCRPGCDRGRLIVSLLDHVAPNLPPCTTPMKNRCDSSTYDSTISLLVSRLLSEAKVKYMHRTNY